MCEERRKESRRESDKKLVDVDALLIDLKIQQRKLGDIRRKGVDHCASVDELYDLAVRKDHYRRMASLENLINGSVSAAITNR
jgi:hypothetical protein